MVEAGPTGKPWLDSNAWLIQLARALGKPKSLWLGLEAPAGRALSVESYLLALADAECCSARWAIYLDDGFRLELSQRKAGALDRWRQIAGALTFFQDRMEWRSFQPRAALAVMSARSDSSAFMSGEVLNLLNRRQLPFCLPEAGALPAEGEGIKAILWADPDPPSTEWRQKLSAFAGRGGLVIVPSGWGELAARAVSGPLDDRYAVYRHGNGRIAVAKQEWQDPYLVVEEAHLLLSRRNDLFRLGNGDAISASYVGSAHRKTAVIHLVNFERRASRHPITLWVKQPFRTARFWELSSQRPRTLAAVPEGAGWELPLPPFAAYAAVELFN